MIFSKPWHRVFALGTGLLFGLVIKGNELSKCNAENSRLKKIVSEMNSFYTFGLSLVGIACIFAVSIYAFYLCVQNPFPQAGTQYLSQN